MKIKEFKVYKNDKLAFIVRGDEANRLSKKVEKLKYSIKEVTLKNKEKHNALKIESLSYLKFGYATLYIEEGDLIVLIKKENILSKLFN